MRALASVGTGLLMALMHFLLHNVTPISRLILGIAFGAAVYPAMLWLVARRQTHGLINEIAGHIRPR